MALASNVRRSTRNDFKNAAGDNLYPASKSYGMSSAESRPCLEKDAGDSNRFLGGLVGNKELAAMTLLAVSLYLINGEYANVVCTALTSVPPAVFSYKVLMSKITSKEGYHSILFYWTLYGLLALTDQFVGTTQGYNLVKGSLLGAVFLHAVRSNPSAVPRSWQYVNTKISSILTSYDSNGFEKRTNTSGFDPISPTPTHFSTEQMIPETWTDDDMDVSTGRSFKRSLEMQTTQRVSPGYVYKTATPQTLRIDEEEDVTAKEESSTICLRPPRAQQFETMSTMTLTCGGAPDIVTVPADRVTFTEESMGTVIQVTNVSPLHLMFALKTNADTYLIAAPTTGVIRSGETIKMRVGVAKKYFNECEDPGKSIDKLAIDYTPIPQSVPISDFSADFFQSQNRRRHAIRVFYQ